MGVTDLEQLSKVNCTGATIGGQGESGRRNKWFGGLYRRKWPEIRWLGRKCICKKTNEDKLEGETMVEGKWGKGGLDMTFYLPDNTGFLP